MSHIITFDTLAYANKLKSAGIPPEIAEAQASAQAELMSGIIDDHLATKQDIKDLRSEMGGKLSEMRGELKDLEHRLLIKLGMMITSATTLIVGLLTILHLYD